MTDKKYFCGMLSLSLLCLLIVTRPIYGDDEKSWNETIKLVKKAVVFLGTENNLGQPQFHATAVLLRISGIFHLLTAKHVVVEKRNNFFTGQIIDDSQVVYYNKKDGSIGHRRIKDIKDTHSVKWVFHPDINVDLALIPYGVDLQNDDILFIPDNLFLGEAELNELMDVFFVSFQPGIGKVDHVQPVYRTGTVATIQKDKTFYIDGAAFPGNSGSPVFIRPEPIGFNKSGMPTYPAQNSGRFIGIVGEYLPYRDVALSKQTGLPRVIFEEHTGLSRVWSIDLIVELTKTPKCQEQISRLKDQFKLSAR